MPGLDGPLNLNCYKMEQRYLKYCCQVSPWGRRILRSLSLVLRRKYLCDVCYYAGSVCDAWLSKQLRYAIRVVAVFLTACNYAQLVLKQHCGSQTTGAGSLFGAATFSPAQKYFYHCFEVGCVLVRGNRT